MQQSKQLFTLTVKRLHRVQQRSSSFAADLRWSEASHWCFTWNNFLSSNVMNSCYKCPRQARYPLKWMNSCTPGRYLVSIFWPQVERQRRIIHLQRKTPGRVTPFHGPLTWRRLKETVNRCKRPLFQKEKKKLESWGSPREPFPNESFGLFRQGEKGELAQPFLNVQPSNSRALPSA